MNSLQSTVYSLQSTVYSLQSTVYSRQSTVYSLQSTANSRQPTELALYSPGLLNVVSTDGPVPTIIPFTSHLKTKGVGTHVY